MRVVMRSSDANYVFWQSVLVYRSGQRRWASSSSLMSNPGSVNWCTINITSFRLEIGSPWAFLFLNMGIKPLNLTQYQSKQSLCFSGKDACKLRMFPCIKSVCQSILLPAQQLRKVFPHSACWCVSYLVDWLHDVNLLQKITVQDCWFCCMGKRHCTDGRWISRRYLTVFGAVVVNVLKYKDKS